MWMAGLPEAMPMSESGDAVHANWRPDDPRLELIWGGVIGLPAGIALAGTNFAQVQIVSAILGARALRAGANLASLL